MWTYKLTFFCSLDPFVTFPCRGWLIIRLFVLICFQRPDSVELTSPQSAWISFTPSTSSRWRTGSGYCRLFTLSCTLPPGSPRDWTPCWVQVYWLKHRQAASEAFTMTSRWCFRRIPESLRCWDSCSGSGINEQVKIVFSRELLKHGSTFSQAQVQILRNSRARLWFTSSIISQNMFLTTEARAKTTW